MNGIAWKHGKNKYQEYYDAEINGVYLCVFQNVWNPGVWMGMVGNQMIHNKTRNDRQRRRQGLPRTAPIHELSSDWLLTGSPEYLMKKVAYCYKHNKIEISE